MHALLYINVTKCCVNSKRKALICNLRVSVCILVTFSGWVWGYCFFASLRSRFRRTFHGLYLQYFSEKVNEKGGGLFVALIEVGMHVIECNPGHISHSQG